MPMIEVNAYAKLNLTLDVLGPRADGYHDLAMVMQSVTLCDTLLVETGTGRGLQLSADNAYLPCDERNLAAAAALHFQDVTGIDLGGISITIQKRIPVCAGLAGGSTDAAAVLRALNTLTGAGLSRAALAAVGERVGSDVPYCVYGGTALVEGRGERITPLPPLPRCHVVLCKPRFSVSTPELFGRIDEVRLRWRPDTAGVVAALGAGDLNGVARRLYNVFEGVFPDRRAAEIAAIRNTLVQRGALGACMSGTGSTVFGLFDCEDAACCARAELSACYPDVFLSETLSHPS